MTKQEKLAEKLAVMAKTKEMVRLTPNTQIQLLANIRTLKLTDFQWLKLEIAMDLGRGAIMGLVEQAEDRWKEILDE